MKVSRLYSLGFLLVFSGILFADKRPPETMQDNPTNPSIEIPAHFVGTLGGIISSVPQDHDRGLNISATSGETFSGEASAESCEGIDICKLEMGYGFFEFYSDRLPLEQVSLTVNGGAPFTNQSKIKLGIEFKDDLSGFASATFNQRGVTEQKDLSLSSDNFFDWDLGDENVQFQEYFFDFNFLDRAGNKTVNPATASVTVDRIRPTGSVEINGRNTVTATPIVNLKLAAYDGPRGSGVSIFRVSNSTDTGAGKSFQFNPPRMGIEWELEHSSGGLKVVYVWYQDRAGNWSAVPSSASITLEQFMPNGKFTFAVDGENVIENSPDQFQTKVPNVPIIFSWDASASNTLSAIRIWGGLEETEFTFDAHGKTSISRSYTIASPEIGESPDGLYTLTAVFIDIDGKESAEYSKSIYLNRISPPNPTLVGQPQIFVSSLSFVAHIEETNLVITNYMVTADRSFYEQGASSKSISVSRSTDSILFVDDGLKPNTPYYYTVRAFTDLSGSLPGLNLGPLVTWAQPPAVSTENPPTGLEVNVIRVGWNPADNPPNTQYLLEYADNPEFIGAREQKKEWDFSLQRDIEGLRIDTEYFLRVKARNNDPYSQVETTYTYLGSTKTLSFLPPESPQRLWGQYVSSTAVVWNWVRQFSTEQGFILSDPNLGTSIATIPLVQSTDTYAYLEEGLTPNTTYTRTIQSYNGFNGGTLSLPTRAVVVTDPAPPLALPLRVNGSDITAVWGKNGNPEGTEYQLQMSLHPLFLNPLESGWITDTSFVFKDLNAATSYYFQVQSRGMAASNGVRQVSAQVFLGSLGTETFDHESEVELSKVLFWKLHLPPNAMAENFVIKMEGNPSNFKTVSIDTVKKATEKARADSNGYRFPIPGGLVEITASDTRGAPIYPKLSKQGELVHIYSDLANQAGIQAQVQFRAVEPEGRIPNPQINQESDGEKNVRLKSFRIWMLDTATESWVKLPSNNINSTHDQISGGVPHFGVFAVMGAPSLDVGDVIAYPVPWRPNGPNAGTGAGQTGTNDAGITFTNIPQEGHIRIFDLQGGLVKDIELFGDPTAPWKPVANQDGEKVTSGTYYWVTEAGGNKKVGKLVIIR